jgi:hypothetical protein
MRFETSNNVNCEYGVACRQLAERGSDDSAKRSNHKSSTYTKNHATRAARVQESKLRVPGEGMLCNMYKDLLAAGFDIDF